LRLPANWLTMEQGSLSRALLGGGQETLPNTNLRLKTEALLS
jgi:hypothetical protein